MSLESLGCKVHHTTCLCGGYSQDHHVTFQYWPDKEYGDTFCISTGLNHYLPWYKRLVRGLYYILGIDNTFTFYVESTIGQVEFKRMQDYINEVGATFQEHPVRERHPQDE